MSPRRTRVALYELGRPVRSHTHDARPKNTIVRYFPNAFEWIAGKNGPSALFDTEARTPIGATKVLTLEERKGLRAPTP